LSKYADWLNTIEFTANLNGGGRILAPEFEKVLKNKKFKTIFEWCAGPSWIGMWLLEQGIGKTLITGDINERYVDFVSRSAKKHNYDVRSYVSNNMRQIPKHEKFDLIVSNPPNYCNIQRSHPSGYLRDDIRPSDVNWKIHADFYRNIPEYMDNDSRMFISEIEIYSKEVYFDGELYDKRKDKPINTFSQMTKDNGLKIINITPYFVGETKCYILEIRKI
jgi:methylase of polypeptide subunit release factors